MANEKIPAIDPHNVPEIICDGGFNVYWAAGRATITFTHNRARTKPLLEDGLFEFDAVVRARIAPSVDNLLATFRRKISIFGIVADARKTKTRRGWPAGC